MNLKSIAVLGDGGWGTTLAIHLTKKGYNVRLWGAFPDYVKTLSATRENRKFLPGVRIPSNIDILSDMNKATQNSQLIVIAVPSQYMRDVISKLVPVALSDTVLLSATKGLERHTHKRMSEVIKDVLGKVKNLAVLSGPSIAYEVAREIPTTVVIASEEYKLSKTLQGVFITERLRVYSSDDVIGTELGGALKNVIAIAAGIGDGLGLGTNAKSALLTRGLAEITRLGIAMGAKGATFNGLSGIGDLVTTCINPHGRNRWFGEELGKGRIAREILSSTEMAVEGVATAESAYELAQQYHVEMPITEEVYEVIYKNKDPKKAVQDLMTRAPKAEA